MYEFHGWVAIREGVREAEDSDEARNVAILKLKEVIDARKDDWSFVELKRFNGADYFILHGFRNHSQPWVQELFEISGQLAPGSYGVLYINDDEDKTYSNEMQVFVMRRGKVVRHRDEFFSPCIPTLEDNSEQQ
jgi:hypothetical protein